MMQAMLKDRFKLEFHRQNKELCSLRALLGKNGLKLKESKTEGDMAMEPNQRPMSVTISARRFRSWSTCCEGPARAGARSPPA